MVRWEYIHNAKFGVTNLVGVKVCAAASHTKNDIYERSLELLWAFYKTARGLKRETCAQEDRIHVCTHLF